MYTRNQSCPKTEPCWTLIIFDQSDASFLLYLLLFLISLILPECHVPSWAKELFLRDAFKEYISCAMLSGSTFLARYLQKSCKISILWKNLARNLLIGRIFLQIYYLDESCKKYIIWNILTRICKENAFSCKKLQGFARILQELYFSSTRAPVNFSTVAFADSIRQLFRYLSPHRLFSEKFSRILIWFFCLVAGSWIALFYFTIRVCNLGGEYLIPCYQKFHADKKYQQFLINQIWCGLFWGLFS